MTASTNTDYSRAINPPQQYRVVKDSFSGASRFHQLCQLNNFTDESHLQDRTGTGYVIYVGANEYDAGSFSLSPYSTVFQAELVAILLATRHVLREARSLRPRFVKIFSDSRSALAALNACRSSCRTVRDTIDALNALAEVCHTVRSASSGSPPTPVFGAMSGLTP